MKSTWVLLRAPVATEGSGLVGRHPSFLRSLSSATLDPRNNSHHQREYRQSINSRYEQQSTSPAGPVQVIRHHDRPREKHKRLKFKWRTKSPPSPIHIHPPNQNQIEFYSPQ